MIIITMAGASSRFFRAGYNIPKYQLEINGKSVFKYSVESFSNYFKTENFIFVIRDIYNTREFIEREVQELGISEYKILTLEGETRGQAETAYLATTQYTDDFPIYIFNIDTFRHNYIKPEFIDDCDGYLEVFRADGEHWSFILADSHGNVCRTTEKDRISDLCSDGLYYFKSKKDFEAVFKDALEHGKSVKGELYIAPLYNELISRGKIIKYAEISLDQIDFCGTPEEYEILLNKFGQN
ncbi:MULTISPECIES: glycosyltransferase family 2 protein [Pseudomonas]|uniref:Glycosyltransferase family 2 protein n=1 Tax=Pseudomonas kielensis TaxID=2762577 RepID=A0A7X1GBP5_9PSED|nr:MULTISPECIES: glycosyltransferase family 2 protein [Pseudomonas]MBC2689520.1 glycosyltransferase family 2 protein [Pseudomonas kielensis]NBB33740.1 capsular biosynthesis protein [Pseudomonas sp. BC115LW]